MSTSPTTPQGGQAQPGRPGGVNPHPATTALTADEAWVLLDVLNTGATDPAPWLAYWFQGRDPGGDPKATEAGWRALYASARAKLELRVQPVTPTPACPLTANFPAHLPGKLEGCTCDCNAEHPDYPGLICNLAGQHFMHYALGNTWPVGGEK